METAYCVKCRQKRNMKKPKQVIKGQSLIYKIMKGKKLVSN